MANKQHKFKGTTGAGGMLFCEYCGHVLFRDSLSNDELKVAESKAKEGCECTPKIPELGAAVWT